MKIKVDHTNAVAYVRRSSDSDTQANSIEEQREAVKQYAEAKGYKIIRWYEDDAISGDDTASRKGFLRMLADAQELRDFKTILCWDRARFGRFDSLEYGYYVHPLRLAGVCLATVMDGVTDWNNFEGRVVSTVTQEGHHQFLISHSGNVARGQREAAEKGSWIGSAPYGYKIEGVRKAKRLVIDGPGKVDIVRRIFREFTEDQRPYTDIARRLNDDNIVSPNAHTHGWHHDSIKVILQNPAYAGDFVSGRANYGKYKEIRPEGVKTARPGSKRRNPESQWTVRRDNHEPIISRATWELARSMMQDNKDEKRRRKAPDTSPYHLNGHLRCGECGCPLHGFKLKGRTRYYECSNKKRFGPKACEGTTVREDVILRSMAEFLYGWLGLDAIGDAAYYGTLQPGDLPEAFGKVRDIFAPKAMPKKDRGRLEKELALATAQIAKARGNLILLDADNIPAAQGKIKELEGRRSGLEEELRKDRPVSEKDINALTLSVANALYGLAVCCQALARTEDDGSGMVTVGSYESSAPAALRRFLGHVSGITIHTSSVGTAKRVRHSFERGEIAFRVDGLSAGVLNVHPVLLGAGVPAFLPMSRQIGLELTECRPFKNGCVLMTYRVKG